MKYDPGPKEETFRLHPCELFATTCLHLLPAAQRTLPRLAGVLSERFAQACALRPGLELDPLKLGSRVGSVLRESAAPALVLEKLQLADLGLACACLDSQPRALVHLERMLSQTSERILRVVRDEDLCADILQQLRIRLLSSERGGDPALQSYGGRAPLAAWLRTLALRDAVTALRRNRSSPLEDERLLDAMAAQQEAPELRTIQHENAAAVKRAFSDALLYISTRDRLLLRLRYVQNLQLDEIARFCGLHRSTVLRNLASLNEHLFRETRERLKGTYQLGSGSVDSLIQNGRAGVELSLDRLLPAMERLKTSR